jgi:hypothetical protein
MAAKKHTHPWRMPFGAAPFKSVSRPCLPNRQFRVIPR